MNLLKNSTFLLPLRIRFFKTPTLLKVKNMSVLTEEVRDQVWESINHDNFMHSMAESVKKGDAKYGDFVISGAVMGGKPVIGFLVQVREEWGAFGSDEVYVRESDETLHAHSNQSFWRLDNKTVDLISPHFCWLPEEELEENPELEYSFQGKNKQKGFLVSSEDAPDRVDSCSMTITTTKA